MKSSVIFRKKLGFIKHQVVHRQQTVIYRNRKNDQRINRMLKVMMLVEELQHKKGMILNRENGLMEVNHRLKVN